MSFKALMDECGISVSGCARLLNVNIESVRNWRYGKCQPPQSAVKQLKARDSDCLRRIRLAHHALCIHGDRDKGEVNAAITMLEELL